MDCPAWWQSGGQRTHNKGQTLINQHSLVAGRGGDEGGSSYPLAGGSVASRGRSWRWRWGLQSLHRHWRRWVLLLRLANHTSSVQAACLGQCCYTTTSAIASCSKLQTSPCQAIHGCCFGCRRVCHVSDKPINTSNNSHNSMHALSPSPTSTCWVRCCLVCRGCQHVVAT